MKLDIYLWTILILAAANIVRDHDNIQTILGGFLMNWSVVMSYFFKNIVRFYLFFQLQLSILSFQVSILFRLSLYDHVSSTSLEHFTWREAEFLSKRFFWTHILSTTQDSFECKSFFSNRAAAAENIKFQQDVNLLTTYFL